MQIRDRIRELRRVKAGRLRPHPKNWRTHPERQKNAVRGSLAELGFADALIARELADGTLELIDGHLRAELSPNTEVPVLIVDLNDHEAAKLLAILDPLASMAETDNHMLAELIEQVETDNAALQAVLDGMLDEKPDSVDAQEPTRLRPLDAKGPPPMSWVLVGIPTVRFGEIAETVERLADIPDAVVETTVNDGRQAR